MPTLDANALLVEIRANQERLDGCLGPHDFQPHEMHGRLVRRHRCTRCGGTADAGYVRGYQRGLEHGRTHSWATRNG